MRYPSVFPAAITPCAFGNNSVSRFNFIAVLIFSGLLSLHGAKRASLSGRIRVWIGPLYGPDIFLLKSLSNTSLEK